MDVTPLCLAQDRLGGGVLATIPSSFGENWEAVQLIYDSAFKKLVLEDGEIDVMYLDLAQQEIESWEIK